MDLLFYDYYKEKLGQNFLSSKIQILNVYSLPKVQSLSLASSAIYLKEINYWYLILLIRQSPGLIKLKIKKDKRKTNEIKKHSFFLTINLTKYNFIKILKNLEEKLIYLKNPAHFNVSKFSWTGERFTIFRYCTTYKINKILKIQENSNFFIGDISLLSILKVKTWSIHSYLLDFYTLNQVWLNQKRKFLTLEKIFLKCLYQIFK